MPRGSEPDHPRRCFQGGVFPCPFNDPSHNARARSGGGCGNRHIRRSGETVVVHGSVRPPGHTLLHRPQTPATKAAKPTANNSPAATRRFHHAHGGTASRHHAASTQRRTGQRSCAHPDTTAAGTSDRRQTRSNQHPATRGPPVAHLISAQRPVILADLVLLHGRSSNHLQVDVEAQSTATFDKPHRLSGAGRPQFARQPLSSFGATQRMAHGHHLPTCSQHGASKPGRRLQPEHGATSGEGTALLTHRHLGTARRPQRAESPPPSLATAALAPRQAGCTVRTVTERAARWRFEQAG